MTARFAATAHLRSLKGFQRATVDHVIQRFYDDDPPARRFLVADETGLGKSMVARGVIARTIERLQDDPSVPRIDVVYVCSNAAIAEQNLKNLDVLGTGSSRHSTRLTLLARDSNDLQGDPHPEVGKRVNLISFTPGTSLDLGNSTGRADERALLHIILCEHLGLTAKRARKAAAVVLRGASNLKNILWEITNSKRALGDRGPDDTITRPFLRDIRKSGVLRRFEAAVAELGRRTAISDGERYAHASLVGDLRNALARAGVDALEPDLVILDEFQRFRHILALDDPRFRDAAELAHTLFDHGDTRVLLLSATPYKPFTYAEEGENGDDHDTDLKRTLTFLAMSNGGPAVVSGITDQLAQYRRAAVDGADTTALRALLRRSLLNYMCRTERPRLGRDGMLAEHVTTASGVVADDIVAFASLRRLAATLDAPMAVDYWKSTPYFVNFGDGYQLGERLRTALSDPVVRPDVRRALAKTQHLDHAKLDAFEPVDPGNARMRQLVADTVDSGWWRLLWMPPSLPYAPLSGPYAEPGVSDMTKRLIFSSWAATPTAIASLVSYAATRHIAGSRVALDGTVPRLDWRVDGGRPAAMTTLALFWPAPALALRINPTQTTSTPTSTSRTTGAEAWYWTSILSERESAPPGLDVEGAAAAVSGAADETFDPDDSRRLALHVEVALDLCGGRPRADMEPRTREPEDLATVIDEIGLFAPGNIAYRCVGRLVRPTDSATAVGHWKAAAVLANGLRSLFNRPDAILLLDQAFPETVYWRAVLQYCAAGSLEAVLDEYLHHLSAPDRSEALDDAKLMEFAVAARSAMTSRPSRYEAFDPLRPSHRIGFPSRFALRYGSKRAANDEDVRQPEIQAAFNSPFWPYVLATTSVGQEGIDFHWWCHAAVHWNTPANPVDFEQREGRVHRFGGHAIRKNLAHHHRGELLAVIRSGGNAWDAAYDLGAAAAPDRHGELAPHWITEGPAKIQRHVFPYPLSHDHDRYRRLKDDLAIYRLTFGQPRQEDLADLLKRRGIHENETMVDDLRLDLRPPGPA